MQHILISDHELEKYTGRLNSLADRSHALFLQQREHWKLLRKGYQSLDSVVVRDFPFDEFVVHVQFNPGRLTSSAAKVDEKSIRERKCFLCMHHLPHGQRGVPFGENYVILCNPFPIFPEHFTIPHREHIPQNIDGAVEAFLGLVRGMGERYTVFYNGPRCGASAPDHLHFQAGVKGFLPIEKELPKLLWIRGRDAAVTTSVRIRTLEGYLRRLLVFEGSEGHSLSAALRSTFSVLAKVTGETEEPMMNLLGSYGEGMWRVILFPRATHRPSFFYVEGEQRLLISPAAVDLGGVCITPLEEDFRKITREHLLTMFEEICMPGEQFRAVCSLLREQIHGSV
jgi:hypothetical protein